MIGLTADAAARLRSPGRRLVVLLALISAPVALVYFARGLLNGTIDTELTDFRFFGSKGVVDEPPDYILPQVTEAVYFLGFALCGAVALSVALLIASSFLVYGNFRKAARRRGYLAVMLGAGAIVCFALAFDRPLDGLSTAPSIGRISQS